MLTFEVVPVSLSLGSGKEYTEMAPLLVPSDEKGRILHNALLDAVKYDPATGVFTWARSWTWIGKVFKEGAELGSNERRYRVITLGGVRYKAHTLAVFYMLGRWPSGIVDHIDLDGFNNRWSNLREATVCENRQNARKYASNTSGHKGVVWLASVQAWQVRVSANGVRHFVGYFKDLAEAAKAREDFAKRLHKEFYREK